MADYGRIYHGAKHVFGVADQARIYDADKLVFGEPYRNGRVFDLKKSVFGAPVNRGRVSQVSKMVFCEFPLQDLATDENTASVRCFAKLGVIANIQPDDTNKTGPVTPLLNFIDHLNPTVNRWNFTSGTLAPSGTVEIDLIGGLRNAFDEAIVIDCLRYIALSNTGAVPLVLGAAASSGLSIWTGDGVRILPGGVYFRRDPGDTPLATFGDTIQITNESADTNASYEIFLVGARMGG